MSEQNPSGAGDDPGRADTQTQAPPTHESQGPRVSGEEMRDLSRLRRSSWDKHVAGVAGGLGRHFDIDPVIIRVAFVVLTFFGGAGLIVYAAMWLIVPDDHGAAVVNIDQRSRNVALIGAGVLAGLSLLGDAFGPGWGGWFPWPLLILGVIAWVLLSRRDRQAPPGTPGTATYAPAGQPYATQPYPTQSYPTQPYAAPAGWAGQPPRQPRPRNPRKRGPILFWFTLGLVALGLGTLGIVDAAGANVIGSAYPALALGIIAVMLVVGAFYGRAGGLIALGLVTAMGLTIGTVVDRWEGQRYLDRPVTAAAVTTHYDFGAGEVVLDLTEVADVEELDGTTIDIDVDLGRIEVIVPDDITVHAHARVNAGGEARLFGERANSGWDYSLSRSRSGPDGAPELTIRAEVDFGEIQVRAR
ncbi:PspC domain-containing protein [Nocardioides sp. AE5]|uniref:PspC domain-containing protein n=1 Tax=Nocardioides sp. AE5 TaxID=2962573 RepID=UPI00288204E6|nr:PspC domain-containing protein [Nocardioides sp. AE5]MDT0202003.1 PspC domain-containing protein [Nocardioides sp. AE5]